MLDQIVRWDQELLLWMNSFHSPFWDDIMWYVSLTTTWIPLYLVVLYLCIRYYKVRTLYILLFTIILVAMTDLISVHLFKNLIQRLRPSHEPLLEGLVHTVRNYMGGDYGFVSSHATNMFGLATFLSVIFYRNLRYFTVISLLLAALISYSRIYLGVHYPGDVLCGAMLGSAIGFGMGRLFCWFSRRFVHKRQAAEAIEN